MTTEEDFRLAHLKVGKPWGNFFCTFVKMVAVAVLILPFASTVSAEEPEGYWGVGHGRYHKEYMKMHNQLGTHCCNDGDCSPTVAKLRPDGLWEAKRNGQWVIIQPDRHVKDAYGLGEYAHICFGRYNLRIYCFIPPNQSF